MDIDFFSLNTTNVNVLVLSHPEEIRCIGKLPTVHLESKSMGLYITATVYAISRLKHVGFYWSLPLASL